jgi:hypothetical protein
MSDGPLERIARVVEAAAGEDPRPATFARGLAIGALVGAAIAGSTIWQRRHNRMADSADSSEGLLRRRRPGDRADKAPLTDVDTRSTVNS